MKVKRHKRKPVPTSLGRRLPKHYEWVVLRAVWQDLKHLLSEDDNDLLSQIITDRDQDAYLLLADMWGPQSISSYGTCFDMQHFKARYLMSSILKKYQFPGSKTLRREAAIKKFLAAEQRCARYNKKLQAGDFLDKDTDACVWYYAKYFIVKVLGEEFPEVKELVDKSRHGPGVTLDTINQNTNVIFKYSEWPYSVTSQCRPMAINLIRSDERWMQSLLIDYCRKAGIQMLYGGWLYVDPKDVTILDGRFYSVDHEFNWETFWNDVLRIVDGNRITFVPKNAKTMRSIAIEPCLNLMIQLGIDGYIRKRLKRFGVDLDDQRKNQILARVGSTGDSTESFSTVDLSAASDTICTEAIKLLFPQEWVTLLFKSRSPQGVLDGETKIEYQKISSMGNGFTFAIESLIFASIVYGVQKANDPFARVDADSFAVYGDDIIVRSKHFPRLRIALYKLGFSLNQEKTFCSGPFRESCGTDWFEGKNVRPVFLEDRPADVFALWTDINRIHRVLSLRFAVSWDTSHVKTIMLKWIPPKFRGYIGPCDDEDVSSYLHTEKIPSGIRYSFHLYAYRFKRLLKVPVATSINHNLKKIWMRMMHDLRPFQACKYSWEGDLTGRRYAVTSRKAFYGKTNKRNYTDYWCSTYADSDLGSELPLPKSPGLPQQLAVLFGYREILPVLPK